MYQIRRLNGYEYTRYLVPIDTLIFTSEEKLIEYYKKYLNEFHYADESHYHILSSTHSELLESFMKRDDYMIIEELDYLLTDELTTLESVERYADNVFTIHKLYST